MMKDLVLTFWLHGFVNGALVGASLLATLYVAVKQ